MTQTNSIYKDFFEVERVSSNFEKVMIAQEVFNILKDAYKKVLGGLHFADINELILKTDRWDVIYFDTEIVGVIKGTSKNYTQSIESIRGQSPTIPQ